MSTGPRMSWPLTSAPHGRSRGGLEEKAAGPWCRLLPKGLYGEAGGDQVTWRAAGPGGSPVQSTQPKVHSAVVILTLRGAFFCGDGGPRHGKHTPLMVHLVWGHDFIFYIEEKVRVIKSWIWMRYFLFRRPFFVPHLTHLRWFERFQGPVLLTACASANCLLALK